MRRIILVATSLTLLASLASQAAAAMYVRMSITPSTPRVGEAARVSV